MNPHRLHILKSEFVSVWLIIQYWQVVDIMQFTSNSKYYKHWCASFSDEAVILDMSVNG